MFKSDCRVCGMENLMLITEDDSKQHCPALDSHIVCIDLAHWLHEYGRTTHYIILSPSNNGFSLLQSVFVPCSMILNFRQAYK